MSWIVNNLIRSSIMLKSTLDIESDDYNNLLVIENKIKELTEKKILTERETKLLRLMSESESLNDMAKNMDCNRNTVTKEINRLCELIAFYLGGEFTDDGYLDYMQEKYELTDEEIIALRNYMHGKYNIKLLRRTKHDSRQSIDV